MDEKERLEAIEVALNNEMGEREFYLKMLRGQAILLERPCLNR